MVFSSLVFMFAYLPITLLAYYLVPRQGRNIFLFIVNLIFYGWGEPRLVLLMVFNIFFNYIGGWLVDKYRADAKKKKLFLILTCVLDIGILAVFKYTGMITETLNMLPFLNIPELQISLPIGISFYTFQTMSYVIDVYRDDAPVSKNFINFGTYVALFPQLIAGPIVRYRDVAEQLVNRRETLEMFTKGVKLFMVGLAKKVIIANTMGTLTTNIFATTDENGVVGTWVGMIAYTFQIYFDFSGYSDMACGLGNMMGFEFLKNFNYPTSQSRLQTFGEDGIFPFRHGSKNMFIFLSAVTERALKGRFSTFSSCGDLQDFGTVRHTTLYFGDFITDFFLFLKNSYSKNFSTDCVICSAHLHSVYHNHRLGTFLLHGCRTAR